MADTKITYADGVFATKSKYGFKLSFDLEKFRAFSKQHFKKGKNGKYYLNLEVNESKTGKAYCKLDDWKPDPSKKQAEKKEENDDLPF